MVVMNDHPRTLDMLEDAVSTLVATKHAFMQLQTDMNVNMSTAFDIHAVRILHKACAPAGPAASNKHV